MKIQHYIILISILALISACVSKTKIPTIEITDVSGKWNLQDWGDRTQKLKLPKEPPFIEIDTKSMKISGFAACNRVNGSIDEFTDSLIAFGPIASTKMMCPEIEVERKFKQELKEVVAYKMEQDKLEMMDVDGNVIFSFRKAQVKN